MIRRTFSGVSFQILIDRSLPLTDTCCCQLQWAAAAVRTTRGMNAGRDGKAHELLATGVRVRDGGWTDDPLTCVRFECEVIARVSSCALQLAQL